MILPKEALNEYVTAYQDPEAAAWSGGTQLTRYNTPDISSDFQLPKSWRKEKRTNQSNTKLPF